MWLNRGHVLQAIVDAYRDDVGNPQDGFKVGVGKYSWSVFRVVQELEAMIAVNGRDICCCVDEPLMV